MIVSLVELARMIRQLATRMETPLITTLTAAQAAVNGIRWLGQEGVEGAQFAGALCGWRRVGFRENERGSD